jgi:hypothetical protein
VDPLDGLLIRFRGIQDSVDLLKEDLRGQVCLADNPPHSSRQVRSCSLTFLYTDANNLPAYVSDWASPPVEYRVNSHGRIRANVIMSNSRRPARRLSQRDPRRLLNSDACLVFNSRAVHLADPELDGFSDSMVSPARQARNWEHASISDLWPFN